MSEYVCAAGGLEGGRPRASSAGLLRREQEGGPAHRWRVAHDGLSPATARGGVWRVWGNLLGIGECELAAAAPAAHVAYTWLGSQRLYEESVETKSRSRPSDSRLRLTGTIVALAGARAELKFRSKNSNAFSHGDQKMSTSEAPPEAGRRTPATQLQLSN